MAVSSASEAGGTLNYVGNADYRGYLAALAANGDSNAQALIGSNGSLGLVNNSGQFSNGQQFMAPLSAAINNENSTDWANYNAIMNGSGSSTGGSGSSSSSTSTDPNAVAYYNDLIGQLQQQLSAAQGEQPTIINNIEQAANHQNDQLNQQESAAESQYNAEHSSNATSRASNINAIDENSRGTYQSLMGLLAAAGSGVSSAAQFGAPQAVALDASGKRAGADTSFNSNENSINTAEGATKQQYQNAVSDLLTQKNQQEGDALNSLLNNEAGLEQQIQSAKINAAEYGGKTYAEAEAGSANDRAAINNIESQIAANFQKYATPNFSVSPVQATTPNLTSYSVDPTTLRAQSANPNTPSAFLPYLASLAPGANQGQQKDQNLLTGGASAPTPAAATAGVAA